MFNAVDYPNQNLLSLTIAGHLTREDYAGIEPTLNEKVKRYGKVNVYLEIGGMDAVTLPALWKRNQAGCQAFPIFQPGRHR